MRSVTGSNLALPRPAPPKPARRVAQQLRGGVLVLVAVLLVAANLRTAVTSVGALLAEVGAGLGLSPTLLGVVATMPTVAFAAFGAATPRLTRRFRSTTLLLAATVLLTAGQAARALSPSAAVFIATSALALAGIAVANILLPALVKAYFPARIGLLTGLYTTSMVAGGSLAAATSVPLAAAGGSWRAGLGAWALLAAAALVPVLVLWRSDAAPSRAGRRSKTRGTERDRPRPAVPLWAGRTRLGWAMACFFGLQSLSAYALMGWLPQIFRDAGFSPQAAGLLLAGVIVGGVPMALLVPILAGRRADQRALVVALAGVMLAAYAGLAVAPRSGALVWMVLLAVGQGAFPLALSLIGIRARTAAGTVALSAFAQSTGYLIAVAGPLGVGMLYEATGGWGAALAALFVAMVIQARAGLSAARPRTVEDEAAHGGG